MDFIKALLCAYVVTGILLLVLALLLYKAGLSEENVNAGILLTYVISTFSGGFVIGKLTGARSSCGAAGGDPVFRAPAPDLAGDLPHAPGRGGGNRGGIRALRARRHAGRDDLVKML